MKHFAKLLILFATLTLLVVKCSFAVGAPDKSLAPMLKRVMPSVVNVEAMGEISLPDALIRQLQDEAPPGTHIVPMKHKFHALGSGVVVDARHGYILTNAHVVRDAKTITVNLSDGRSFHAKLVGLDAPTDIAVLKIKAKHLRQILMGDSGTLQVGDFVVAIGNPYGLNQTVTSGIVSALKRNDLNIEGYENFIQTDAPINPGNSGGALVDTRGRLMGINTAILSTSGGNQGIGFAIPVNMARDVMQQLIKYGKVERGTLGVYGQSLTPKLAKAFDLPEHTKGVAVTAVIPDSAASKAKLETGDIIKRINGKTVTDPFQLRNALGLIRINTPVKIELLRNNKIEHVTAYLTKASTSSLKAKLTNAFYGVQLRMVQQTSEAQQSIAGAMVVTLQPDSVAAQSGLLPNDVIVSANHQMITSIKQLQQIAKQALQTRKPLLLNVHRGPGALFVVIGK